MKKISLMFILIFLNINVWAIGSDSKSDTNSDSPVNYIEQSFTETTTGFKYAIRLPIEQTLDDVVFFGNLYSVDGSVPLINDKGIFNLSPDKEYVIEIKAKAKANIKKKEIAPVANVDLFKYYDLKKVSYLIKEKNKDWVPFEKDKTKAVSGLKLKSFYFEQMKSGGEYAYRFIIKQKAVQKSSQKEKTKK